MKISANEGVFFDGALLAVLRRCADSKQADAAAVGFFELGKVAELLARCNVLSRGILDPICAAGTAFLASPASGTHDPKVIGRWALQLAAAGATDQSLFTAAADACLRSIEWGLAKRSGGSHKGTRGWGITPGPHLTATGRLTVRWVVGIAAMFASAGLVDPAFYASLARYTDPTAEEHAIAGTGDGAGLDGDVRRLGRHVQNVAAIAEMGAGTFGLLSSIPMLLTHAADCQMHVHMTPAAYPSSSAAGILADVRAALDFGGETALGTGHPTRLRPLMLDIGSGRGSWLLGLASADDAADASTARDEGSVVSVGYIGIERSPFLAAKATGLARRLGLDGRVQFVSGPVQIVLDCIERVRGPRCCRVASCLFPTPFAVRATDAPNAGAGAREAELLTDGFAGNQHLPREADFMLSPGIAGQLTRLLEPGGGVFAQSNTEEVAVYMHETLDRQPGLASCPPTTAVLPGFGPLPVAAAAMDAPSPVTDAKANTTRTERWRSQGGGSVADVRWLTYNPWTVRCGARSETEVRCDEERTRVFRFFFRQAD